jgi:hypothetical protein
MLVLTSSFSDPDWPDALDRETSMFTYFGDNKRPGRGLHETPRHGNEFLRTLFEHAIAGSSQRPRVPPVFVFSNTGDWRDVMLFLGLAVPEVAMMQAIQTFFADRPHDFERCAAAIARLMLPDIAALDLTRPSRDRGRDAVGQLRLGCRAGTILVDFALEAKCYGL